MLGTRTAFPTALSFMGLLAATASSVRPGTRADGDQLAREIFEELIEINTTDTVGDNTKAARVVATRLLEAGFSDDDVFVGGPHARKGNLVARLRGSGSREPILLLAHLDVVEARREDWSVDPFTFLERDGYFYGRGTSDDKAMAAIWIANLILMKQEGFVPDRDLIVALTADEEGGDHNGVRWLLSEHRSRIDAQFCLNEGGGGQMKDGVRLSNTVQLSEKVYQSFRLEVVSPGGHSSRPRKDNAIIALSEALVRLARHEFPVQLDEITSSYFERSAQLQQPELRDAMLAVARNSSQESARVLSASAYYNAVLRTTCVATQLSGGHAENALPQTARATVNCRIFPGSNAEEILEKLREVVSDPNVAITPLEQPRQSPPSPLDPEIMGAIERVTQHMWPGIPVIPTMSTGATDGLYLRNAGIPTYGVSGIFTDVDDSRAHGKDERIATESFFEGREFLYLLVKELSQS